MFALGKRIREMLRLHTNPHAVHGRFTLKDNCERKFWNEPFRKLKESINDVVTNMSSYIMSTIYEQSITAIDDTMAEDLIVSCCTEANNSVAQ